VKGVVMRLYGEGRDYKRERERDRCSGLLKELLITDVGDEKWPEAIVFLTPTMGTTERAKRTSTDMSTSSWPGCRQICRKR